MREQRPRQSSSLEKIRVSTGMVLEPASHSASSVVECEPGSPLLERPNTLPELNSRPASRVMKSFSCDGVGGPVIGVFHAMAPMARAIAINW